MQTLELAGDFTQCQAGIGCVDPGHQRHQAIFRKPGRGFAKQCRIGHAFGDQPSDCSSKAFRRPVEPALLQDTGNVVLGMVGSHPLYGWKLSIGRGLKACSVRCLLRGGHLGKRFRSAFANRAGRARDAPEPCSWTSTSRPATRNPISCASVACSSADTRA